MNSRGTCRLLVHVCFTPESGHVQCNSLCLLWANSGHIAACKRHVRPLHRAVETSKLGLREMW